VPSEQATAGLKMLNQMQDPRSQFFNMIPASMYQTFQLVRAVQLSQLVGQSPAPDPVGHDDVRLTGHRQTAGKYFEEERPEGEDVVAARPSPDRTRVGLESVRPLLQQLGARVDDVGRVGGVVEQRQLNFVLHEHIPGTEAAVDDVLGVEVAERVPHLVVKKFKSFKHS